MDGNVYDDFYTVYTQIDCRGNPLSILFLGDGQYGIQDGDDLLPGRWDAGQFIDCVREYQSRLGSALNLHDVIR